MLRRHLNFRQIFHRFTSSFANPSLQDLKGSYYVLKHDNFKSVEVQGWTPLKILMFLPWTLRPTFTTLLGKRRAISHWMAVPKTAGNVNRPPYRYTVVTHWACPASSVQQWIQEVDQSIAFQLPSAEDGEGFLRNIQLKNVRCLSVLVYLWCLLKTRKQLSAIPIKISFWSMIFLYYSNVVILLLQPC